MARFCNQKLLASLSLYGKPLPLGEAEHRAGLVNGMRPLRAPVTPPWQPNDDHGVNCAVSPAMLVGYDGPVVRTRSATRFSLLSVFIQELVGRLAKCDLLGGGTPD